MLAERDAGLLREVVAEIIPAGAEVQWVAAEEQWSAHARVSGSTGLVGHLLTSPEWQEARFEEPKCSAFITTSTDADDVRDALSRLARAVQVYVLGGGRVERGRGLLGSRPVLVLRSDDGEWRIGQRSAKQP